MLRPSHKGAAVFQTSHSNRRASDTTQFTPSKTSKYDNYTPRKRYMKQQ